jgi:hypothetical protein
MREDAKWTVLMAGFALALSSFLLVYLVSPRRRLELARRERVTRVEARWKGPALTVCGETVHSRIMAKRVLGPGKHLPGPMGEIGVQARTKAGK